MGERWGLFPGQSTKIGWRNINSLRYVDDATLMAESKEELESLLMTVKEGNEKAGFKLDIKKAKVMASSPITSWQIVELVRGRFPLLGL